MFKYYTVVLSILCIKVILKGQSYIVFAFCICRNLCSNKMSLHFIGAEHNKHTVNDILF